MANKNRRDRQSWAMDHDDVFGAGARKRDKLPCIEKPAVVMKEFYRGTLHSGSGGVVTNVRQAKAIAMSEKRRCQESKR